MEIDIKDNIPLAPFTTFGIGGNARYFVEVGSEDELLEALYFAKERKIRHTILAGGSNVLISDDGIDALVIHIVENKCGITDTTLDVGSGYLLFDIIKYSSERGLGGWESLAGIPGTIGGAVRGNAGAFGTEIKDMVVSVRAYNTQGGKGRDFSNTECTFAYRNSFFKSNPNWIILDVIFELVKVNHKESMRHVEETVAEREKRHIQNVKSAGSFFMNPIVSGCVREEFEKEKNTKSHEGRVPAGWLIEKVGMKGARIGGAEASVQHPNYFVNMGNATASDVLELASLVKKEVQKRFGVYLKEEVSVL